MLICARNKIIATKQYRQIYGIMRSRHNMNDLDDIYGCKTTIYGSFIDSMNTATTSYTAEAAAIMGCLLVW